MGKKTILLIKDNPDDELLVIGALKKCNILNELVVVRDGAGGSILDLIQTLFHRSQCWILLLLKIDCLEVLRRIREDKRTSFFPVIILTSSSLKRDIIESYNRGTNSYIQKHIDFNKFVQAVKQLALYWLILNIIPENHE